jgi:hypothetical protein
MQGSPFRALCLWSEKSGGVGVQTLCLAGFRRVASPKSSATLRLYSLDFGVRAKAHGPFVDKALSGGHNEKASLEL